MHSRSRTIAASSGLAFGAGLALVLAAADAAPMPGAARGLYATGAQLNLSPTAYRRCWTHNGKRHCGSERRARADGTRSNGRYSDYYEHIPERLPFGSQRWWDEMVRENRGGNGGGGGGRD
jgi:hypothetical protein